MLRGLRSRTPVARVSLTSFSFRPRIRPEIALFSPAFACSPPILSAKHPHSRTGANFHKGMLLQQAYEDKNQHDYD